MIVLLILIGPSSNSAFLIVHPPKAFVPFVCHVFGEEAQLSLSKTIHVLNAKWAAELSNTRSN
jgi:hypothetical protein